MIKKVVHLYESHKHKFFISLLSLAVVITVIAGVFIWRDARAKVASKSSKPKISTTEKSGKDTQAKNGGEPTQAPTPTPTTAPQPAPVTSTQKAASATTYAPAASAPASAPVYSSGGAEGTISSILFGLINGERARVGVGALTSVGQLQTAAAIRVAEEAITSFAGTDHTRPNGSSFDTAYAEAGYTGYTAWGENLVYGYQSQISTDQSQLYALASQMFTSWKNSPGHYANMINGNFNQSGIGVKLINQGGNTYYFAIQDFARR